MLIETFEQATSQFRSFLGSRDLPPEITWVFREDLLFTRDRRVVVVSPVPPDNLSISIDLYARGRERGLASMRAISSLNAAVLATIWLPLDPAEELQGWNTGLKLSAAEPLPVATACQSKIMWWLLRKTAAYRRSQAFALDIQSRVRVAA